MKFQHYFRSRTYIVMKAKEVVLDSLWRVLLIVLLPHKIAEPFRKLLVTITQANSSGHLSKLLTAILAQVYSWNSFMRFWCVISSFLRHESMA